jgi:NAD(P)-dependent dehydrogenase (short-subunit alcohol dehydrogenase family)
MTSDQTLTGKTAVVTGGSRGLGRGVVEALAGRGARVLAIARDASTLASLARDVRGVETKAGDATDDALAEATLRDLSPDILVLCAGAMPALGALQEQTWESFNTSWNVDTKSAFVWLRHVLKLPLKAGAHVIVVSSGAAIQGSPVSGGYAPAKRAQWFLSYYAATESQRAGLGVRIHCLLPNLNPSTELGRAGIRAYAARQGVSEEDFAKRFLPHLTPEAMGRGVLELIAEPSQFEKLAYRIGGAGLVPQDLADGSARFG